MIICCGEALIDMLPCTTTTGAGGFVPHAGGAVFNSAIALGRLGANAGFFSGLSSDFFGQLLIDHLQQARVDSRFCVISDQPTTLAFVRLHNGQASYNFYDENSAGRLLSPHDLPQFDPAVQALLFGGISLIAEPCGSAYEALMLREAPHRVIMLDPNIRSHFITDKAKHLARLQRMIAVADIIKVSDEDIAWFDQDRAPAEIAQSWLARSDMMATSGNGAKIVIITKGADGAEAYAACGPISIRSEKTAVVDTVGAGDTLNAGILASLERQGLLSKPALEDITSQQLSTAVQLGVRAAAITVSRSGANPPWDYEMPAL